MVPGIPLCFLIFVFGLEEMSLLGDETGETHALVETGSDEEVASSLGDEVERHVHRSGTWFWLGSGDRERGSRLTCTMDLTVAGQLWIFALTVSILAIASALVYMEATTESTRGWIETTCLVKKRALETRCATNRDPCPNNEVEARLNFVVETSWTKEHGIGEVNAFWGPGPETWVPNVLLVRGRLRSFVTLQKSSCWYKPEDPTKISMVQYARSTENQGYILHLTGAMALLIVLLLLSLLLRAAMRRQEEMLEADRRLELELEKHQKTSIPRWLMMRLSSVCRVRARDIISEGPIDCAICLDELFIEFDTRRVLRIPCNHLFHEDCMAQWVLVGEGKACPLCQYELNRCPRSTITGRTRVPNDQPSSARGSLASGSVSPRSINSGYSASEDEPDGESDGRRPRIHRSPWR